MSRVKWVLLVVALALVSAPVRACDDLVSSVSSPFATQIVPAVLHLPGPGEEPLYSSIRFAEAPPVVPGNRCEAQCLADFRQGEAECRDVLDLCMADCTDGA